jgi:uncharacterized protein
MGLFDSAREVIVNALRADNPHISQADMDIILTQIDQKIAEEPPPRVAIIGEAGVGKSSTLNSLFNAGVDISHTEACTKEAMEIRVPLGSMLARKIKVDTVEASLGDLIVYDMPGLGEGLSARNQHLTTYDDVLRRVDAAVWILDAPVRSIEFAQAEMARLDKSLTAYMTFALNKVDTVFPGETAWYTPANLPSPEQEKNIKLRIADVESKVREALPHWRGQVIGYSAKRRFNLPQLFAAMLDGVARERRWVLIQRKSLADYFEFVDPQLLPDDIELPARPATGAQSPKDPLDVAREALSSMSPQQFQAISSDKRKLDEWLAAVMNGSASSKGEA